MSFNVPNTFQTKFKNNVEMQLQQQNSALQDAVVWQDDSSADKIKIKDIVGNNMPQEADERHGDTKWNNTNYDGVWLAKPPELYDAQLVDNADRLATMIDLDGTATMSAAGTINRARDRRVLEGFYAPTIGGKDGTIVTPFPSSQVVPVTVGGASGPQPMNTKKLREANIMLGEAYVDTNLKRFMALSSRDNDALLSEVPATSADFKEAFGARIDENGRLTGMLGWNFIHLELDNPFLGPISELATDASGYRKTPFWVKGGLYGNYWQRLRTRVGEIPEKLWSTGYLSGTTLGATRTQPGMSGIILNQK